MEKNLSVAFVRRGYSPTGGAEAYLKRFARGVMEAGHDVQLVATNDWPDHEWTFGSITHLRSKSPIEFASELERMRAQLRFDVLFSLERVWNCDVYRASDGVHRAGLDSRTARRYKPKGLRCWREEPVLFLGQRADLLRIYAAADIFILPTIYDPFSNACLEALACGLPVITTRSNGFSEIIEDGVHGSIVDHARDLLALRNAIRLWSDPSRRAAARSTNSQLAAQFDILQNINETLAILYSVA